MKYITFKKILVIVLAVSLLFLAACSGGKKDSDKNGKANTEQKADTGSHATEETDSESSATEDADSESSATEDVDSETNATEDADKEAGNTGNSERLKEALSGSGKLEVSKELISLFFNYYSQHPLELRLLPSMKEGGSPDWDELTHFGFSLAGEYERGPEQELVVSEEVFDRTVRRYFKDLKYTPKDSSFVIYTGSGYRATGWDDHGGVYYRLISIKKENGAFVATFEGVELYESDYWDDYDSASPVMKAIMDKAQTKTAPDDVNKYLLEMFTSEDYAKLDKRERVTVKFELTDDPDALFTYLAVDREYFLE